MKDDYALGARADPAPDVSVSTRGARPWLGPLAYGTLFVVVVPSVLVIWAHLLDRSVTWPMPHWPIAAIVTATIGGLLMLLAMCDLMVYGRGLPMNAYPPQRFVARGAYALVAHPIYTGAALLSAGAALWARSSGGLYIVTPTLIFAMLSLVYGYERLAIQRRYGAAADRYRPFFSLPPSSPGRASWPKKVAMLAPILLPWLLLGFLVRDAGSPPGDSLIGLVEVRGWSGWVAFLTGVLPYLYVVTAILTAETEQRLRRLTIGGSIATALGIYAYALLLGFAADDDVDAWTLALVTTGLAVFALNYRSVWNMLRSLSERAANSRRDWLCLGGRFRVINHSIYSGLAGVVGVGLADYVIGNSAAVLTLALCILAGGALFAQLRWGSNSLLRPFGYWGAILGGILGLSIVHLIFDISISRIALAGALCGPFAQALGRVRCLVQGCCHGVVTTPWLGIRVWQGQSRVVTLSGLKGQSLLNTQGYSLVFNLMLGLALWAMRLSHGVSSSIVIGGYLIATAIERFAEDAYRGEKQTREAGALRENQWIAIGALIVGIVVTILPGANAIATTTAFNVPLLITALVGGLLAAFAMSMDFPQATARFARLSG